MLARQDRFVMIEDGMLKRDPLRAAVLWLPCSLRRTLADVANHTTAVLGESYDVFITVYEVIKGNVCTGWSIVLSSRSGVVVVMECSLQMPDRALTTCRHPPPLRGLQFSVCSAVYWMQLPVVAH